MIIIAILGTIGLFYLLYVYSGTSLTPAVFYEEVEISNYQVIITIKQIDKFVIQVVKIIIIANIIFNTLSEFFIIRNIAYIIFHFEM